MASADGDSVRAACIGLTIAQHIDIGQGGIDATVQQAANIDTIAAGELLVVEVQAQGATQMLGIRVVLAIRGSLADVVVAARLVVRKVALTRCAINQTEGILWRGQRCAGIARGIHRGHTLAEGDIVGLVSGTFALIEHVVDADVVLVAMLLIG